MEIEKYINSGMLETYVAGAATPEEEREILYFKDKYPEIKEALDQLERDMEAMAKTMSLAPPPGMWKKIEAEIDDIIARENTPPNPFTQREHRREPKTEAAPLYIDAQIQDSHIKIHKAWRWIFAAVFILGKIFLGTAIYFYLETRQAQQQIMELKTEIKALK